MSALFVTSVDTGSSAGTATQLKRRDIKARNDPTDLRRRRADTTISLRKARKEQGLAAKRRHIGASASSAFPPNADTAPSQSAIATAGERGDYKATGVAVLCASKDVPELAQGLRCNDVPTRVEAARRLRKVLSLESDPPVDAVIDAGAVPLLVLCLDEHDHANLQFEAAWALTNIASTNQTRRVVEHGAVSAAVRNLRHHNPDLREQCAWCLGNIAGDCGELRDLVLTTPDALAALLLNVTQPATESLLRNCVWALSNMCRGKPQPEIELLAPALPVLMQLLTTKDKEALVDTCWALSYLSDGNTDRIAAVMSAGVVAPLIDLLKHDDSSIVTPALRTLGNFVSGDDTQTQAVLDAGVLPHLEVLLRHNKKNIRKETCWTLSNIVAGTPAQMAVVCDSSGILPAVIEQLDSGVWEVQKEANFVVSNVATAGNAARVRQLVEQGAIKALCQMLDRADAKVILVALDGVSAILSYDDAEDMPWAQLVDEAGGLDRLELLQEHENRNVYEKAVTMIEEYFGRDDEEAGESFAPSVVSGETYSFGMASFVNNTTTSNSCATGVQSTPSSVGSSAAASSISAFGSPPRSANVA